MNDRGLNVASSCGGSEGLAVGRAGAFISANDRRQKLTEQDGGRSIVGDETVTIILRYDTDSDDNIDGNKV